MLYGLVVKDGGQAVRQVEGADKSPAAFPVSIVLTRFYEVFTRIVPSKPATCSNPTSEDFSYTTRDE